MRSRQLDKVLTDYVHAAGAYLSEETAGSAEVPFEVGSCGGSRGAVLYCYRAVTGPFIAERDSSLKRLPGHDQCASLLEHFDGLERYLARVGAHLPHASRRGRAEVALKVLIEDVFDDRTDFEPRPDRVRAALDRLERSAAAGKSEVSLLATLHGVAIESPEVPFRTGLTLAQPDALSGLPPEAVRDDATATGSRLVVLQTLETNDIQSGLVRGREALVELLRALRLFGDCTVRLGGLGWSRVNGDAWQPLALAGAAPPSGAFVVSAEHEDELRAFCSLAARRWPREGELAWALRRFELGCDRDTPLERLTDHLLALRALLEPEGPLSGLLPGRLAVLCAEPHQQLRLTRRVAEAIELERAAVTGAAAKSGRIGALADEIASNLRALLSDVIGGHLDPDLVGLADRLLHACDEDADTAGGAGADATSVRASPGRKPAAAEAAAV